MKHPIINKIILVFGLIGIMTSPMGWVMAASEQTIVGSWCLTATRSDTTLVPVVWHISADGNIISIAPAAPINASTKASIPVGAKVRLPASGEVVRVGPNEWEADYQYFEVDPLTGALLDRVVFKNPITYDRDSDELVTPAGKVTTGWIFFPNGTGNASPITATLVGKRIDPDRTDGKLCDIPIFP